MSRPTLTCTMVRPFLSHPLNDIPGDTQRVLKEGRNDTAGRWWPPGSIFQPSCGGHDADAGCRYVEVVMLVEGVPRVRFHVSEGK
jgi:hypothetical protein